MKVQLHHPGRHRYTGQQTPGPTARRIWLTLPCMLCLLMVLSIVLSACSSGPTQTEAESVDSTLTYADLPAGLGRGYPAISFAGLPEGATGLTPGQPAPNFRMVLDDGNSLTLADLQGNPILINFWATWCGPCRIEMPDIVRHHNAGDDLIVIAVNVQEDLAEIGPFAEDFQMNMPIVRDQEGELRRRYDLLGMPTSIFIDRDGNVSAVWPGILTPSQIQEFLADIL